MSETSDIDAQLKAFREAEGDNLASAENGGHQVNAKSYGSSALVIKIGQDAERLIVAVLSKLSVSAWFNALAALALLWVGWNSYVDAREKRMLEYYIVEVDGKLIANGIVSPDASWSYRKSHPEQEKPK